MVEKLFWCLENRLNQLSVFKSFLQDQDDYLRKSHLHKLFHLSFAIGLSRWPVRIDRGPMFSGYIEGVSVRLELFCHNRVLWIIRLRTGKQRLDRQQHRTQWHCSCPRIRQVMSWMISCTTIPFTTRLPLTAVHMTRIESCESLTPFGLVHLIFHSR